MLGGSLTFEFGVGEAVPATDRIQDRATAELTWVHFAITNFQVLKTTTGRFNSRNLWTEFIRYQNLSPQTRTYVWNCTHIFCPRPQISIVSSGLKAFLSEKHVSGGKGGRSCL